MPTPCFMLEEIVASVKIAQACCLDSAVCRVSKYTGGPCRVEIEVPVDTKWEDTWSNADDGRLLFRGQTVTCGCGKVMSKDNRASPGFIEHSARYRNPVTGKEDYHPHLAASPGAMWYARWLLADDGINLRHDKSTMVSEEYKRDHVGKRAPVIVMLPAGSHWCVDSAATNRPDNGGWTVTGDAPTLTAHPSINATGYHGWLQNGVLSDPV
jgi:hypothetical protein